MITIRQILGENLLIFRGKRTQKAMAAFLDLDDTTYGRLERGENFPSEATIVQICEKLDVSQGELFRDRTLPTAKTRSMLIGDIVDILIKMEYPELETLLGQIKEPTPRLLRAADPT